MNSVSTDDSIDSIDFGNSIDPIDLIDLLDITNLIDPIDVINNGQKLDSDRKRRRSNGYMMNKVNEAL
jgi:hypothetical protein